MEKNLEMCECGHEQNMHEDNRCHHVMAFKSKEWCPCSSFRPAPSQPSMEVKSYACKACGYSPRNRSTWCDLGCGSDYNEMIEVNAPKKEKESTEVRDEKIARIIKEFREKFSHGDYPGIYTDIEAWLTQTLTTLLNEE